MIKDYLNRLIPATQATAVVAAIVHVTAIGFAASHIGLESIYIALITYIISLVITIPVCAILLVVVGFLRLNLILSMLLFLAASLLVVIATTMYFFEAEILDIPWQYTVISVPASLTAWYFSVYFVWTEAQLLQL